MVLGTDRRFFLPGCWRRRCLKCVGIGAGKPGKLGNNFTVVQVLGCVVRRVPFATIKPAAVPFAGNEVEARQERQIRVCHDCFSLSGRPCHMDCINNSLRLRM